MFSMLSMLPQLSPVVNLGVGIYITTFKTVCRSNDFSRNFNFHQRGIPLPHKANYVTRDGYVAKMITSIRIIDRKGYPGLPGSGPRYRNIRASNQPCNISYYVTASSAQELR